MSSKNTPFAAYLVRKNTKLEDALSEKARSLPRHPKTGTPCVIVKHATPREPWWWDVVSGLATGVAAPELALPGAVMFLETSGRLFALTFGHGYSMLNPGALEPDFGLRAVLQAVDAAGLRSVDVRSMEASPLLSRRQRHEGQAIQAFGIDRLHDLLKGITGRLQKQNGSTLAGTILTGADGVHATADGAGVVALTAAVDELFSLASKGYPPEFKWVAHLRLVKTETDIRACWAQLLKNHASVASFGPPHPLEGHELGSLRVSWDATARPGEATQNQAIARLAQLKGLPTEKAIARLRGDRLQLVDGEDEVIASWRAYDCLGAEIRVKGKDHILTAGDWYRLDGRYKDEVEAEFDRLLRESKTYAQLTPWLAADTEEKIYNARVGPAGGWKVLDRKTYRYGRSQVELCDLLDPTAALLVHVKRGRHSATLSHLFSQGIVSALTILQDTGARDHLASAVALTPAEKSALATAIDGRQARVVYAIADHQPKGTGWKLPFFAMLAATQAATRLREHRLAVDLVRVHDTVPLKKTPSAGKGLTKKPKKKP